MTPSKSKLEEQRQRACASESAWWRNALKSMGILMTETHWRRGGKAYGPWIDGRSVVIVHLWWPI